MRAVSPPSDAPLPAPGYVIAGVRAVLGPHVRLQNASELQGDAVGGVGHPLAWVGLDGDGRTTSRTHGGIVAAGEKRPFLDVPPSEDAR